MVEDDSIIYRNRKDCETPRQMYFQGTVFAMKGIMLLYGAFLAFESRYNFIFHMYALTYCTQFTYI